MVERPVSTPSPRSIGDQWIDSGWQSEIIRPLLIALLAACFVAGLLAVAHAIEPALPQEMILALCTLTAIIGVFSTQWLGKPGQRLVNRLLFRGGELILIAVLLRLLTWVFDGDLPGPADVRRWILAPGTFFDGVYVTTVFLALIAWQRSTFLADIFQKLALTPAEVAWREEQRSGAWRSRMPVELVRVSRQDLAESFATHWLIGGGLLVFAAGLSRLGYRGGLGLHLTELGLPPQLITAILAYFLVGLVLLSQARLAMLRARWLFDGVEGLGRVPIRWQRLSLLIVLGIGLAATLLPLGSTWQAGRILTIVVGAVIQVVYTILYALFLLFVLLLSLLGLRGPIEEDLLAPPAQLEPILPPPETTTSNLPPWLGGLGFWLVAIAIVIGALAYVLGKQGIALNWATLRRAWQILLLRLRNWWQGVRHLASSAQISFSRKGTSGAEEQARRQPWRFIRIGGLPPREKIRYFYLSTVRRAGEKGMTRRPSQTPLEFVQDLESAWPEAELDVEALTEAFVTARYDAVEISEPVAKDVQSIWERVKKALRGRRRGTD